jgi:small subunit ribosomal protein S21
MKCQKLCYKSIYLYYMLIVEIKKGDNIERALKTLKSKVIKTKQNQSLLNRKEYTKPSVRKRTQILKAIYCEKVRKS